METVRLMDQLAHLPPAAQRIVADLIELLSQQGPEAPAAEAPSDARGAILLPPLDVTDVPTTWPENEFANPEFCGAWANRTDIGDSTEFVRNLRREQWGAKA